MEERIKTGIDGLDTMLKGGFPKGHVVAIVGNFGTGKTTFAMQFANEGLKKGENVIYITLEEGIDSIMKTSVNFGWDFQSYVNSKKLALIKLEPADAKTTAIRIDSELPKFIKSFNANRVVVDSITLFNMMFSDESERRTKIFNLCRLIKETNATALFTAETKEDNPNSSRYGLTEYAVDGVVLLRYVESEKLDTVKLSLRVVKMRRSEHDRAIRPYVFTKNGIMVYPEQMIY